MAFTIVVHLVRLSEPLQLRLRECVTCSNRLGLVIDGICHYSACSGKFSDERCCCINKSKRPTSVVVILVFVAQSQRITDTPRYCVACCHQTIYIYRARNSRFYLRALSYARRGESRVACIVV